MKPNSNFKPKRFVKEEPYRINEKIVNTPMVRIVGDNIESRVCSIQEALKTAKDAELDLVEISPSAQPPVCKIIEYSKFKYEQKRKAPKPLKVDIKELRFTPTTDEHDFNFKLKHAIEFLKKGDKVKATVFFSGREITYKEQGEIMLLKLATQLEQFGKVEHLPKLEGKRMSMVINTKTPKKAKA
jgi:translation initiation factor IF-3